MQLMLLEQQNKKRLLMARQEQDNVPGVHQQGAVGAPGFANAMSPQGSRAGPSPNPTDQMKRGTPKLGQQVLPGSPMPDGMMQQQRGSPAPMGFDATQVPPGMPPQFYPQIPQNPMMRPPPSSHPGANFSNQQLIPQQMEAMRNGQMQNGGVWRGPPQQGMMPGQQQMGGPMGQNPQQRQMPPPPAPIEQPRPEPSPSQSNQAPPTPLQTNKGNPKKKQTKDNKVKPNASHFILSYVDIDIRSPQTRKARMQVRQPRLRMARNLLHRHHRRPSRQLRLSISNPFRTGNHSNLYKRPLRPNSSLWTTTGRHLVILILM